MSQLSACFSLAVGEQIGEIVEPSIYHCACVCVCVCGHVYLCVHPSIAEFNSGSDQNDPQQDQCPALLCMLPQLASLQIPC